MVKSVRWWLSEILHDLAEWITPASGSSPTPSDRWKIKATERQKQLINALPPLSDTNPTVCKHLLWSMSDQGVMICNACKAPIFDWPSRLVKG